MREVLTYPQTVLLLAPAALFGLWPLLRRPLMSLGPRARAAVLCGIAVLPMAAVAVPYHPALAGHLPLPWRPPIAWGVALWPGPELDIPYAVATLVAAAVLLVPPIALVTLLIRAARDGRRIRRTLRAHPHPAGFLAVDAPGVACTVGLVRPRIMLSQEIWESEHGPVILRHEQTHAAGRHPLILTVARATVALWSWLPGTRRVLADLRDALEEHADSRACRDHGRVPVARALVSSSLVRSPAASLGFGGEGVEGRLRALSDDAVPSRSRTVLICVLAAGLAALWLLMF
jgi:hypothetical protein